MLKNLLVIVVSMFFSVISQAKGPGDGSDKSTPNDADMVFKIDGSSVMYRKDGYMLVCVDKSNGTIESCSRTKEYLSLDEFWKWYFPAASNLHVVGMDYRTYFSTYIFWLKR